MGAIAAFDCSPVIPATAGIQTEEPAQGVVWRNSEAPVRVPAFAGTTTCRRAE